MRVRTQLKAGRDTQYYLSGVEKTMRRLGKELAPLVRRARVTLALPGIRGGK